MKTICNNQSNSEKIGDENNCSKVYFAISKEKYKIAE